MSEYDLSIILRSHKPYYAQGLFNYAEKFRFTRNDLKLEMERFISVVCQLTDSVCYENYNFREFFHFHDRIVLSYIDFIPLTLEKARQFYANFGRLLSTIHYSFYITVSIHFFALGYQRTIVVCHVWRVFAVYLVRNEKRQSIVLKYLHVYHFPGNVTAL